MAGTGRARLPAAFADPRNAEETPVTIDSYPSRVRALVWLKRRPGPARRAPGPQTRAGGIDYGKESRRINEDGKAQYPHHLGR